jgi:hypothetical protein
MSYFPLYTLTLVWSFSETIDNDIVKLSTALCNSFQVFRNKVEPFNSHKQPLHNSNYYVTLPTHYTAQLSNKLNETIM